MTDRTIEGTAKKGSQLAKRRLAQFHQIPFHTWAGIVLRIRKKVSVECPWIGKRGTKDRETGTLMLGLGQLQKYKFVYAQNCRLFQK